MFFLWFFGGFFWEGGKEEREEREGGEGGREERERGEGGRRGREKGG